MNAQELRIGNFIDFEFEGKVLNVLTVEIDSNDPDEKNNYIVNTNEGYYPLNVLTGIPLTEEWLLKFGFGKTISYHIVTLPNKSLEVAWNDVGKYYAGFRNINSVNRMDDEFVMLLDNLKHVHQLQNLFYCLSGTELKLKEPATA